MSPKPNNVHDKKYLNFVGAADCACLDGKHARRQASTVSASEIPAY